MAKHPTMAVEVSPRLLVPIMCWPQLARLPFYSSGSLTLCFWKYFSDRKCSSDSTIGPSAPVVGLRWRHAGSRPWRLPSYQRFLYLMPARVGGCINICSPVLEQVEPMMHLSSQHCIQWHRVGSLKLIMVGVFMLQKSAITTNKGCLFVCFQRAGC